MKPVHWLPERERTRNSVVVKVDELPGRFARTDPARIENRLVAVLDAVDHEIIAGRFCHRDGVFKYVLSHSEAIAEWPEGAGGRRCGTLLESRAAGKQAIAAER